MNHAEQALRQFGERPLEERVERVPKVRIDTVLQREERDKGVVDERTESVHRRFERRSCYHAEHGPKGINRRVSDEYV
jgi:hypothetical protein